MEFISKLRKNTGFENFLYIVEELKELEKKYTDTLINVEEFNIIQDKLLYDIEELQNFFESNAMDSLEHYFIITDIYFHYLNIIQNNLI